MNDIRKMLESLENIDHRVDIEDVFLGDIKKDPEKDTPVEKQIEKILTHYMRTAGNYPDPALKKVLYKLSRELMKLKQRYPDDLIPNTNEDGYVYRGKEFSDDIMDSLSELSPFDIYNDFFPFEYHPKFAIQSWTIDTRIAKIFAGKYMDGLILRVKPDDSFIFSSKLLNQLGYADEDEVLRASPKPIQCEAKRL